MILNRAKCSCYFCIKESRNREMGNKECAKEQKQLIADSDSKEVEVYKGVPIFEVDLDGYVLFYFDINNIHHSKLIKKFDGKDGLVVREEALRRGRVTIEKFAVIYISNAWG